MLWVLKRTVSLRRFFWAPSHWDGSFEHPKQMLELIHKKIISNFTLTIFAYTVKPVLSSHLKIDKMKVVMENGSLMKVESIAEC